MTEDQIPKFLRITPNEEKKELSRFAKLIDAYEDKFNNGPPTEPSNWDECTWCMILEECIKEGKTVKELLEIEKLEIEQGGEWDDNW